MNKIKPCSLGFRPVARIGTRSQLAKAGRKRIEAEYGDRIAYLVHEDADSEALFNGSEAVTYMWIEADSGQPLYIGMANFGMKHRADQHEGGFYGTAAARKKQEEGRHINAGDVTAGLGHARRIRRMWNHPDGRRELDLWVRRADRIELFGGSASLAATEEQRLIDLFCPPPGTESTSVVALILFDRRRLSQFSDRCSK